MSARQNSLASSWSGISGRGRLGWAVAGMLSLAAVGCGGSAENDGGAGGKAPGGSGPGGASGSGGSGAASGGSAGAPVGGASGAGGAGGASGGSAGGAGGGSAGSSSGGAGGTSDVADPRQNGPAATTSFDGKASVPATKNSVPMHCVIPSGPSAKAPFPVVLVAHGFQLPASQYDGYANRLATHGIIGCTVDFPAGFSANHAANAQDVSGALDWVLVQSTQNGSGLFGKVDINQFGAIGHSLGGKVSVLAAKNDPRIRAVLGLDPVDTSTLCDATKCPDASNAQPLGIPTAYLGETTDATAGITGQACAPSADNFQTFYQKANGPSLEVTLNGANHMSFVDDVAACGVICSFCNKATQPAALSLDVSRAYSVAFFARFLKGETGYDAWLTGANAKATWIDTGQISVQSK